MDSEGFCAFAHPDKRTGRNMNVQAPWGGKGRGKGKGPWSGKGNEGGGQGGAAVGTGRKIIGRAKAAVTEEEKSDAVNVKEEAAGGVLDPRGLVEAKKGVEVGYILTLTEAREALELDEEGNAKRLPLFVEKEAKPVLEALKGFFSVGAETSGVTIKAGGLQKVKEAMITMFEGEDITRAPGVKQVLEDVTNAEDGDEKDPLANVLLKVGGLLSKTVEAALAGKFKGEGSGTSPKRKKRKGGASPKKAAGPGAGGGPVATPLRRRAKDFEDLRRRIEEDSDDEEEEEEMGDAGAPGHGAAGIPGAARPLTREELFEKTAEVLENALEVVETKLGELGRKSDEGKTVFDPEHPVKDMPIEWVGTGTGEDTELKTSDYEACVGFVHDFFEKSDVERALQHYVNKITEETHKVKRSADVPQATLATWNLKARGLKRMKMMIVVLSLTLAKRDRTSATT